jgi:putative zinc finger protein
VIWSCSLTEERLSDVLDGALPADESAAFSAHVVSCDKCKPLLAQVGGLVTQLHRLPAIDEPPFLASRIIAATRGTPARRSDAVNWFAWLPQMSPTRLAMGAFTVAASFLIVFHAVSATSGSSVVSPAGLYRTASRHAHLTYARGVKFVNDLRVVYVIQSRLSSQPQPATGPTAMPSSEPDTTPPRRPPDSQARPEPTPNTRRDSAQRAAELAVWFVPRAYLSFFDEATRSLP